MKTRILFLFLFAASISFSACNKETEGDKTANELVGKWTMIGGSVEITVSGVDIIQYMVANFGINMEDAQSKSDSLITEIIKNTSGTFTFNSNGTYNMSITNTNQEENGTWYVSSDGNTLNLFAKNDEKQLPILSISSTFAILEVPTQQEDVDLDSDGTKETTVDLNMTLRLNK